MVPSWEYPNDPVAALESINIRSDRRSDWPFVRFPLFEWKRRIEVFCIQIRHINIVPCLGKFLKNRGQNRAAEAILFGMGKDYIYPHRGSVFCAR